ncbi:phytoene/squalene synthase family protein [Corynebacterium uterequi]|uniref:Phytoene/squalene synthetase n=1 Tax=Corynebacterium uterequi TaxID=1072256 RepID=A0A0G3HBH3_9CORY|nr:squalene/phytoene synthase family protein [Corynebacterium uterequi]AKK10050.1 phytoene/squalene synthetase [Corynebacterium uterequi]
MPTPDYLHRYDRMADRAAGEVIAAYSTSFGLSTALLAPSVRRDIRNLYAMVRIADEIVDGTAAQAGTDPARDLDAYERAVLGAPRRRFHTDPVLHAYANTARRCDFDPHHVQAFFASMRRDLTDTTYTATTLDDYIYGSAEVIGLLCLAAFYAERRPGPAEWARLEHGARCLGAAFQKINFLRDFAEDSHQLGRAYFPGTEDKLDNPAKDAIIADIRRDLDAADAIIPLLPRSARAGVMAASALFAELTTLIDGVDAAELSRRRVRVPAHRKALLISRAVATASGFPQPHRRNEHD